MVSKLLRTLLWLFLGVFLLIAVILGGVWWKIDSIAQHAVESGATNSTGLNSTTDSVHVSLLSGDIDVDDLRFANVEGYGAEHLMTADSVDTSVEYGSLWTDTLRVPEVEIERLTLNIEQRGLKNNVSELLAQMRKRADEQARSADAAARKRLQVDRVVIKDITAHVQLLPLGREASTVTVTIPELVLDEVSPEGAKAVAVEELMRRVIPAVIAAVLEQGQGVLPEDLMVGIGADLGAAVTAIGEEAGRLVHQAADDLVGGVLKDVPGAVGKTIEGVGKEAGERIKGVFDREKKE